MSDTILVGALMAILYLELGAMMLVLTLKNRLRLKLKPGMNVYH